MTTPVFTNNASTTLAVDTTTSATTITVVDASIFNTLIQNGAGATNGVHEMATLSAGLNTEVVKVTNANTTTEVITVVREQEGTTGYAFLIGDDVKLDITAATLQGGWYGRDIGSFAVDFGTESVDLVTSRSNSSHGATGIYSIAIGYRPMAGGIRAVAIGYTAETLGDYSVCVGENTLASDPYCVAVGSGAEAYDAAGSTGRAIAIGHSSAAVSQYNIAIGDNAKVGNSGGDYSIAIGGSTFYSGSYTNSVLLGYDCNCSASYAIAIGNAGEARITKTHNISGPSIIRKDDAETDEVLYFSGQENIIFSQEYDFTLTAADNVVTVEIPTGSTFFISEVGFMPTVVDTPTVQPTIEFGSNTTTDAILVATATTSATVKKRERYTTLASDAENTGHTTQLTMSVTVAATATTFLGRVYFKGMLLEDE